jgi:small-conductance mechanosensitive channel
MSLDQEFLNNTLADWLIALGLAVVIFIVLGVLKSILRSKLSKLAKKTKTDIDDVLVDVLKRTKIFFFLVVSVYIAGLYLILPKFIADILYSAFILTLLVQGGIWGIGIINFFTNRYKTEKLAEDAASATTFTALGFLGKIVLWSAILLLALDNLGFNITTLVAGLGISGIAIALAVQNILGDLFASLSIVLDKPFVLGDFIIVDNHLGSVEHIGLKTTRIRSLSGEQLIFSNADLLQSRIRNFKRMAERRVVFALGVIYQTPSEKLKKIPGMIKEMIDAQELTRFDRAHFKEFGDFSLNFEVVYWIASPDYNKYMDTQQTINLLIYDRFTEEGIEFAYPTQSLFLERNDSNIE